MKYFPRTAWSPSRFAVVEPGIKAVLRWDLTSPCCSGRLEASAMIWNGGRSGIRWSEFEKMMLKLLKADLRLLTSERASSSSIASPAFLHRAHPACILHQGLQDFTSWDLGILISFPERSGTSHFPFHNSEDELGMPKCNGWPLGEMKKWWRKPFWILTFFSTKIT